MQHLPEAERVVMALFTHELRRALGSIPNSIWTEDLPGIFPDSMAGQLTLEIPTLQISEQKGKRFSDSRPHSLRHSDGCHLNY